MENPNEEDKARALRSQLNLCRRMAEEVGDPDLAEEVAQARGKTEGNHAGANRGLVRCADQLRTCSRRSVHWLHAVRPFFLREAGAAGLVNAERFPRYSTLGLDCRPEALHARS